MDLSQRSYQKELLDDPAVPFEDIRRNMQELEFINRWLGGHQITLSGFRRLLGERKEVHVCEIGCGGGDNLKAISNWCRHHQVKVRFTAIDLNPNCIEVAGNLLKGEDVKLISSSYEQAVPDSLPDIVFSSLFCHHFTDTDLVFMMRWMREHAGTGFFINDLQRHPMAYRSIQLLTRLFSKSYLVKNDAPLSVARGFTRVEWEQILGSAGIAQYNVQWKWAFRWLITARNS